MHPPLPITEHRRQASGNSHTRCESISFKMNSEFTVGRRALQLKTNCSPQEQAAVS